MEKNIQLVTKAFKIFETGNINELEQYIERDFIEHTPDPTFSSDKKGIEYLMEMVQNLREGLSNVKVDIKQIISDENKVVVYSTFKGRHTGRWAGLDLAPTNKDVAFDNIDILEIKNDKIAAHWGIADNLSLLLQLDVISEKELMHHS
jgi:predicted ester cyclase